MKKHAKIIGSLGLAAALSVGVFAASVPVNAANTQDVTIELEVREVHAAVNITLPPENNQNYVGAEVPVEVQYSKLLKIRYELTNEDTGTVYYLPEKQLGTGEQLADGTDSFTLNVEDYGGYGHYTIKAIGTGQIEVTDYKSFNTVAFDFTPKGKEEETGNPVLKTLESPGTKYAMFQAYRKGTSTPVFSSPIRVEVNSQGEIEFTLPFAEANAPEGIYTVVGTPYDAENREIDDVKERDVDYIPVVTPEPEPEPEPEPVPDVPDTGSFFGGLGLTQNDVIATGLAILFVCSFFGIMIIAKKTKKDSRR